MIPEITVLTYYFRLQYLRQQRRLLEWGMHPVVSALLIIVVFIVCSQYLFIKLDLAPWIYLGISYMILIRNMEEEGKLHLETILTKQNFRKIAWIENAIIAAPFLGFLFFKQHFLQASFLVIIILSLPMISHYKLVPKAIPTPFKKLPFELPIGFRKSILLFPLVLFITFKGIQVANTNLVIATIGAVFLIFANFYIKAEPIWYVWIFSKNRNHFLLHKLKQSLTGAAMITIPIAIILAFIFPNQWMGIILVEIGGLLLLGCVILAKYSAFPHEMGLPQGILLGLILLFPPMIVIAIPIFYKMALRKLEVYLK